MSYHRRVKLHEERNSWWRCFFDWFLYFFHRSDASASKSRAYFSISPKLMSWLAEHSTIQLSKKVPRANTAIPISFSFHLHHVHFDYPT